MYASMLVILGCFKHDHRSYRIFSAWNSNSCMEEDKVFIWDIEVNYRCSRSSNVVSIGAQLLAIEKKTHKIYIKYISTYNNF